MTAGLVLDASTTVEWAFDDESGGFASRVLDSMIEGFAVVPRLWRFDVANALAVGIRRRRITPDHAAAFVSDLDELDIREAETAPDSAVLALEAVAAAVTAYDAAYLVLARELALPLATCDRDLARAARAQGVVILT